MLVIQCAEEEMTARPCRGTCDGIDACSQRHSVCATSQAEGEHPVENWTMSVSIRHEVANISPYVWQRMPSRLSGSLSE